MEKSLSLPIILGCIFIVLKLLGKINWAWVWVLSPFWIPVALYLLIVVVVLIIKIIKEKK